MIPYGEKRFLASAGIDRCYKVWDLEQPNCVECVTTRGLAVDGAWMNNWPCSVLSYDDALGYEFYSFKDMRYFTIRAI